MPLSTVIGAPMISVAPLSACRVVLLAISVGSVIFCVPACASITAVLPAEACIVSEPAPASTYVFALLKTILPSVIATSE